MKDISELLGKNLSGYTIKLLSNVRQKSTDPINDPHHSVAVFEDNTTARDLARTDDRYFVEMEFALTDGKNAFFFHGQSSAHVCTTVEEAQQREEKYRQVH